MGAFGYLPKPYDLDQLIEVLKDAYAHRMRLKFADDEHRTQQLLDIAVGSSPLAILRAMHELDTDER
jgi:DNA-binding NtrC family response regulator